MRYRYVVAGQNGKRQRGSLEAESPKAARQLLRERFPQILSVKEERLSAWGTMRQARLNGQALVLFTRQLATLLGASLPLEEALLSLAQQSEKNTIRHIIEQLRRQVLEGRTFSDALAQFPASFSPLYRALITAGELSGHLDAVLSRLADHLERSQALQGKLLQALLYPLVLTTVALGVVAILLTAVVPGVVEQFMYLQHSLPLSTRILIALSDTARDFGLYFLLAVFMLWGGLSQALKRPAARLAWHRAFLRVPVVGRVALNLNIARYARTLSILTSSAVPLLDAMGISAAVVTNQSVQGRLEHVRDQVREGRSLAATLGETGMLSPMMRHMIASGENSGELENMLERAADLQENAFHSQVSLAMGVFTPVLITGMAGIVFFIVMAILQPILQLNSLMG